MSPIALMLLVLGVVFLGFIVLLLICCALGSTIHAFNPSDRLGLTQETEENEVGR